jgi:hypothetical protein
MLLLDIPVTFLNNGRQSSVNHDPGAGGEQRAIPVLPDKLGESGTGNMNALTPPSASADVARRPALLVAGQGLWSRASLSDEALLDMLGLTRLPVPAISGVRAAAAAVSDLPAPVTPQEAPSPFVPVEQTAPLTMPGAPPIPADIPRGQNASGAPLAPRGGGRSATSPSSLASEVPSMPQLTPSIAPQPMPEDPNAKAQELARQQQDILMLRQQMDDRLKDIETAEQKMQDMIREAKGLEDKKVRHLIQVYANMKPKVAAKAIESLDERVAVRILSGMVPKQSGEILTYTNPEKTAKLTELLTRIRISE